MDESNVDSTELLKKFAELARVSEPPSFWLRWWLRLIGGKLEIEDSGTESAG